VSEIELEVDANLVLSALGDSTRRAIVDLVAQSPASVSDLANALSVTKTAIGQHIVLLEACHLVSSKKIGRVRICRIDQRGLNAVRRWIEAHEGHWQANLRRLGGIIGESDA
jgi:DNA-binding transcriptional ArsR family regulator